MLIVYIATMVINLITANHIYQNKRTIEDIFAVILFSVFAALFIYLATLKYIKIT